jgi:hypothetical protein
MMSLDPRPGEFARASCGTTSLNPFTPWFYFLELATKLYATPSLKYLCFVLSSCIYASHKGAFVVRSS